MSLWPYSQASSRGTISFIHPGAIPLTVIAPIVMETLGIKMDDVSADVIQEALVMGNNEQCLPPALEIAVLEKSVRSHNSQGRIKSGK